MSEFERFVEGLSADEADRGRRLFRAVRVGRGELFVRQGDPPNRVALVERGLFRLFGTDEGGNERTLAFRAEGELVCAYSAALRQEPSRIAIEALEPSEVLVAERPAYDVLVAENPGWQQLVAKLTEELYLRLDQRQRELLLDDASTRYQRFVADHGDLASRLTQRHIAAYVGVTPEALSRIRRRLISINDSGSGAA
ncbi:MAG: Crp/Fnr family transcriptional regulator [Kribbellaceae bacterium]|nr:Crp/Fnr family transcriptional regulator [Kribbellaceae bacterium]